MDNSSPEQAVQFIWWTSLALGVVVSGVLDDKQLTPATTELDRRTGGAISRALKTAKFKGRNGDRLDLAPTMGRWMASAGRTLLSDADALVPVPLHWRRQWARRFNQSALLAEVVAKAAAVPVSYHALKRVKATPQQVGLSQSARAQNVQGAFRVPADGKAEVAGRRLILIDDVLTSGATMDACARALLRAGAAQVDALVFARVVAGARNPI